MGLRKRVEKVFSNVKPGVDVIIIKNSKTPFIDENFFYVTGFETGLFENSAVVIWRDGGVEVVTTTLEESLAEKNGLNIHVYRRQDEFYEVLRGLTRGVDRVGVNFEGLSLRDFDRLKNELSTVFEDVSDGLKMARVVKDELEITCLKKAAGIADLVMGRIPEFLSEGVFEYELAAEIEYLMKKNGADGKAFETISSFGENTAKPHYMHGDRRLRTGDFVVCDFGVSYRRYKSDVTRTFFFKKMDEEQREMYETVLRAQRVGFEMIREGVRGCEVHEAVSDFIEGTRFKGFFVHSTGHSLGLNVHDPGISLGVEEDRELRENMVVTVEPGVYVPGFGGVRIEDDVLVKKNGCEILTRSSRDLFVVQ